MIKLLIFDLDGVLIESQKYHREALNRALKEVVGIQINDPNFEGLPTKTKLEMLVKQEKVSIEDVATISELKKKYTDEFVKTIQPNPALINMMENLRGFKTAVCSNAITPFIEEVLTRLGIRKYFDIITGNEKVRPKPDPEMYINTMKHFNVTPEETWIFEDSPVGLKAARDSGANVCVINNNLSLEKVLSCIS